MLAVYKPDYIEERYEVTGQVERMLADESLPVVHGLTHDKPGTVVAEQGLSFHNEDGEPIVGYHIIDVGAIPVAGELEGVAYQKLTDHIDPFRRLTRLFHGPNIENRLNLLRQAPVISFYFGEVGGEPSVTRVERSIFRQTEDR